ncbi:MAG: hypothetical protein JST11_11105 [Acidobacteria bacterium]|nr:hypothetical protein [Acidobacteriota bacterium]
MRTRSWIKLAGCIGIDLLLIGALSAADYKAASADAGSVSVLALEDARGTRAVFIQTGFRITRQIADFVSARIMKTHELDRAGILLRWNGLGARPPQPDDVVVAVDQAFTKLEPAVLRYTHRGLSVAADEFEHCLASLSPDASLAFEGCWKDGTEITGGIRAAFQMVEPAHGLVRRDETVPSYPVQAIGLGKVVTILALSGEAPFPEGVNPRGLIYAPFSNESTAPPKDARIAAAVQRVLARTR